MCAPVKKNVCLCISIAFVQSKMGILPKALNWDGQKGFFWNTSKIILKNLSGNIKKLSAYYYIVITMSSRMKLILIIGKHFKIILKFLGTIILETMFC